MIVAEKIVCKKIIIYERLIKSLIFTRGDMCNHHTQKPDVPWQVLLSKGKTLDIRRLIIQYKHKGSID